MIGTGKLAYLATPYTKFPDGPDAAFEAAARLAGLLTSAGVKLYSPIVHSHVLARAARLDPFHAAFWLDVNAPMLARCDVLIVGQLQGWDESAGVEHEIATFVRAQKPVYHCHPQTLTMVRAPIP